MIGIIITARLGSKRLPDKHLLKVGDINLIQWLVQRISFEFNQEIIENRLRIILATTRNEVDKSFQDYLKEYNCEVFFGNSTNIPKRHLECSKSYGLDSIINVDGDDFLVSMKAIRLVYNELKLGKEKVSTNGLPIGMNVMGYSTIALEVALSEKRLVNYETGWGGIFHKLEILNIPLRIDSNEISNIRLTCDYPEDYLLFKTLYQELYEIKKDVNDIDLISYIIDNKLYEINSHVTEKYWENFNNEKNEELQ